MRARWLAIAVALLGCGPKIIEVKPQDVKSTVVRPLLLPRLSPLIEANPALGVEVFVRELAELPGMLRSGEIDFAVLDATALPPVTQQPPGGFFYANVPRATLPHIDGVVLPGPIEARLAAGDYPARPLIIAHRGASALPVRVSRVPPPVVVVSGVGRIRVPSASPRLGPEGFGASPAAQTLSRICKVLP